VSKDAYRGPCIETHFNPEILRPYFKQMDIDIKIRQVDIETFRYWRMI